MKLLTLDEIKQAEFGLLKKFDSFCRQNKIRYFLSNGTLLGAVKYKGFIPWDDDIDVLVPREDYERLVEIFKDDDAVSLISFEREPKYLYPFAKLCDRFTIKDESGLDNGIILGLNIDVFPLDSWNDKVSEAVKEVKNIKKHIIALNLAKLKKTNASTLIKRFVQRILMIICKIFTAEFFLKKIIKKCNKKKENASLYLGCKSWCIYGTREIIPAQVFEDSIEVEFEGSVFPAPIGYDRYLRSLYGNYWEDLPIEKQKTHHAFKAYKL